MTSAHGAPDEEGVPQPTEGGEDTAEAGGDGEARQEHAEEGASQQARGRVQ